MIFLNSLTEWKWKSQLIKIMKQKTLVLCKGDIAGIPPVMTYILTLLDLGHKVDFIAGSLNSSTEEYLKIKSNSKLKIINLRIEKKSNKLRQWYSYRKAVHSYLTEETFDAIWISTFDTALCIWSSKIKSYNSKTILSVLELYDSASFVYKKALAKILPQVDKIVVPEYNRACILRTWYNLKETPTVIPNKPYEINLPQTKNSEVEHIIGNLKTVVRDRKIVLYQGLISEHRNLDAIAKVTKKLEKDVLFVLMGKDFNYLDKLREFNDGLYHISFIPSPYHLKITSICDIGIVSYNFIDLNNIYCAPNKIWEYSAFGKPMIGNNIPGLEYTIGYNQAGICVDTLYEIKVECGIQRLLDDYDKYSKMCHEYYESVKLDEITKTLF